MSLERQVKLPDNSIVSSQEDIDGIIESVRVDRERKKLQDPKILLKGLQIVGDSLALIDRPVVATVQIDLGDDDLFENEIKLPEDIGLIYRDAQEDDVHHWTELFFEIESESGALYVRLKVPEIYGDLDMSLMMVGYRLDKDDLPIERKKFLEQRYADLIAGYRDWVAKRLTELQSEQVGYTPLSL